MAYISRQQMNVLAPDDTAQGPVSVVVTNHGEVSAPFTAQLQPAAPALFQLGATSYATATHYPDYAVIGNPAVVPGTVAAKPGDILTSGVPAWDRPSHRRLREKSSPPARRRRAR